METASAAVFLYASILGFWTSGTRDFSDRYDRLRVLGISLFSLLLFLSEISFGARFFDFEMPPMEGGGEFDGGHDVAIILVRMVQKGDETSFAIASVLLLLLVGSLVVIYLARESIRHFLKNESNAALTLFVALLSIGVLLDLLPYRIISTLEEATEFTASLILAYALFLIRRAL